MIKNKKILGLEIVGTFFIILLGTALHFTFAFSGQNPIVGLFSAVNESVWEHLKLPFWPSLLWLLIMIIPLKSKFSNFFSAKTVGMVFMIVIIPIVFYSYTSFTKEILAVDIATFMIAVIIGQLISYKLYRKEKSSRLAEVIAIAIIVALAIVFIIFTFNPPHLSIFMDTTTGQYGI